MAYPRPNVKYLILFCTIFIHSILLAQPKSYWQQEVNYKINVKLNDTTHFLEGFISVEYTNHSPDKLPFIYFHLWPNAYKNDETAFAKQMLENGETEFYYSDDKDRGYIDSLDFKANDVPVTMKLDSIHIDICKLTLNHALEPGEKTTITTPFRVKIPDSFSRLGHIGQSYQITQWYPKPAVYDREGWHPIPYLNQGEFYSEYGKFDVDITLPKNYVVGASGDLQTPTEVAWLDSIDAVTKTIGTFDIRDDKFPKSSSELKTLHYHLENAHDFGWFADKRYHVRKSSVKLPNSQREVTSYVMFTNSQGRFWQNATEYVNDGIYWYSKWIGEYPYNVATAVDGGLSAGGGMEYPTITVIARVNSHYMLEDVIVHEIGHNWFYGILGTNERLHPWMDEGVNTFYEYRYLENKYPNRTFQGLPGGLAKFLDLDSYHQFSLLDLAYRFQSLRNEDQPIELTSEKYTDFNYGAMVYLKTGQAMRHMRGYIGDTLFDKSMQAYFDQWKFKHPYPADMQATLEKESGKNLAWFYGDYISTNKRVDYAISKIDKHTAEEPALITISNHGQLSPPFSISAMSNDTIINTVWYNGSDTDAVVTFPAGPCDFYRIDAKQEMVEYNRKNDTYRNRGILHKSERLRFQFIGSIDNPYRNQLYFAPAIGWNNYDKTLVGLAFYNHFVPGKHLEYELVPMIGTGSGQFAFVARAGYTWTPLKGKLKDINFSVSGKRFTYHLANDILSYNKVQPQLTFNFKPKNPRSTFSQQLKFRSVTIFMKTAYDTGGFDSVTGRRFAIHNTPNIHYTVQEISYSLKDEKALFPYSLNVNLQQGNTFVRLFAEARALLNYKGKKQGLNIRLFGGGMLWDKPNGNPNVGPDPGFRLTYGTGNAQYQKDFLFDELFFARYGGAEPFNQQVIIKDAGFRITNSKVVSIKNWVLSANFSSTIHKSVPLRPYFSMAAFGNDGFLNGEIKNTTTLAAELGISVVLFPEILEVNFPLLFAYKQLGNTTGAPSLWYAGRKSGDQKNVLAGSKYYQLISFTANINKMNPFMLIKNIKL